MASPKMLTGRLRIQAGRFAQDLMRQFQFISLKRKYIKSIVVGLVVIQIVFYLLYLMTLERSYNNKLLGTSTLTRYGEEDIVLDLQAAPNLVRRYLAKTPQLLEKRLFENCMSFFELSNNTEFYEIMDKNFHPEQYASASGFYTEVLRQVQEQFKTDNKDITTISDETDVLPLMDKYVEENKLYEASLKDLMARIRVYGKCFLENRVLFPTLDEYELMMFPYLQQNLPEYKRWDGTVVPFPIYDGKKKHQKLSRTFLQNLQDQMNGKGIVFSIGDKLIDETCQLIRVIRYLNNTLPIQFVHNDELTQESKDKLIEVSRSEDIKGPKQDVWIVDVARCLSEPYKGRFRGFNSKWLAVLFNSFEEIVLMDNDLVPFINPVKFFTDFEGYNRTGTFFFKDRESFERTDEGSRVLIDMVLPSAAEKLIFDIPNPSSKSLASKLHFFEYGAKHFMESGIVVLNKAKNFKGLVTSINVQLIGSLTNPFYGDKEIFWLGQVLQGNDDLYFNSNPAGNIGKFEDASKYSKVIKSIQPAHISPLDDHTLLWVNSGLRVCKKSTAEKDFKDIYEPKDDTRFKSIEDLERFYNSPLEMDGVIIPPNSIRDWNNDIHEPSRGFNQMDNQGCGGYYWFAYSSVGTPKDPPQLTKGKMVVFTDEEKLFYKSVSDAWFGV